MDIFSTWRDHPADARGAVAAIGNFDGVHLGHLSVIDQARDIATATSAPLGIVTFEPHPRAFFAKDAPPFRLMNAEAKANRLGKIGVDHLYQLEFDSTLAGQTPEKFVQDVLANGLGLSHVLVGADFCFGKGRAGGTDDLKRICAARGIGVTIADLVEGPKGEVSSTAIRKAVAEGRTTDARDMLGHWHRIDGPVIHGEKRGRTLGFPTANMALTDLHQPKHGVYAVIVDVMTGPHQGTFHGAASIGVRPMFGKNTANCETFLFDFKGDLYDAHLSVALVEYLRPEMTFDGVDALVAQMDADCDKARALLSAL